MNFLKNLKLNETLRLQERLEALNLNERANKIRELASTVTNRAKGYIQNALGAWDAWRLQGAREPSRAGGHETDSLARRAFPPS